MAAEHWFRWHHGTVTDPKWRVIASRCVTNVTVGHVVAVWSAMLENASQATPRGELQGWDDEDIAVLFGYTTEQVQAIRQAMQGKVLDGTRLLAWEKRQPNREDSSTERTREWRKRKRDESNAGDAHVTHGDESNRDVTLETETETEEKQKTLSASADSSARRSEGGKGEQRTIPVKEILAAYHASLPMMPAVRVMTDARKRKLKARWTEDESRQSVEYWQRFFAYVAKSDFLTGRDGRWTGCDFEWLIEASNHVKVIEGKYENREAGA